MCFQGGFHGRDCRTGCATDNGVNTTRIAAADTISVTNQQKYIYTFSFTVYGFICSLHILTTELFRSSKLRRVFLFACIDNSTRQ